jgi:hypothetical protein
MREREGQKVCDIHLCKESDGNKREREKERERERMRERERQRVCDMHLLCFLSVPSPRVTLEELLLS